MTSFKLQRVHYMPAELEPFILYVSEEFDIAIHLCACGCGSRIPTPLGPTEWEFSDNSKGPTLNPSIGNWQKPCQSHYFIRNGEIKWAPKWTKAQIEQGRQNENERSRAYYEQLDKKLKASWLSRLWRWFKNIFKRNSRNK